MSCGRPNQNQSSCPPACCPPIVIKTKSQSQQGQCCVFQLPPVNIVCEIPAPPRNRNPPKVCCIPIVCCEDDGEGDAPGGSFGSQGPSPGCCIPMDFCSPQRGGGNGAGCGKRKRREKRFQQCNFLKPKIDTRIYRDGEHMCISYAGHIPGEQFISGKNLATTTTFAKRRLCQYTPYEFVGNDGCCTIP